MYDNNLHILFVSNAGFTSWHQIFTVEVVRMLTITEQRCVIWAALR